MNENTKVTIYGDSIMRGTIIDESKRYHATISDLLGKLARRFGIDFKNRAHFGITADKGRDLLEKDLRRGLECEYAVIEFGGNDCSYLWEEVATNPESDHKPFTPIEKFTECLTDMVTKLQGKQVTPVLMTLPPIDAERHLHYIGKDENAQKNILHWLGDVQMIYRFHELYSATIARVAKQTRTILVDVRRRFLHRHDLRSLVGLDGVHLSSAGYALVVEAFADFIEIHRKNPELLVYG